MSGGEEELLETVRGSKKSEITMAYMDAFAQLRVHTGDGTSVDCWW